MLSALISCCKNYQSNDMNVRSVLVEIMRINDRQIKNIRRQQICEIGLVSSAPFSMKIFYYQYLYEFIYYFFEIVVYVTFSEETIYFRSRPR